MPHTQGGRSFGRARPGHRLGRGVRTSARCAVRASLRSLVLNESDLRDSPQEPAEPLSSARATHGVPADQSGADVYLGSEDYRAMYDHSPNGVLFTSPDGQILAANRAACEILGRNERDVRNLGRRPLMDHDDARWEPLLAERARKGHVRGIARMIRGDGTRIEVEMSSRLFTDGRGQVRTCTVIADVTERIALERELLEMSERLRALAATDELTGLHNRREFITVGRQMLEIASRQHASVAMLFVDIDNLKVINDRYGHDAGDGAIRAVAESLRQELRSADTIARIGGDEFAALTIGLQSVELPLVEARIRGCLARVQAHGDVTVDVSIGWTVHLTDRPLTIEQLLADADHAMYLEKTAKRQSS